MDMEATSSLVGFRANRSVRPAVPRCLGIPCPENAERPKHIPFLQGIGHMKRLRPDPDHGSAFMADGQGLSVGSFLGSEFEVTRSKSGRCLRQASSVSEMDIAQKFKLRVGG